MCRHFSKEKMYYISGVCRFGGKEHDFIHQYLRNVLGCTIFVVVGAMNQFAVNGHAVAAFDSGLRDQLWK